ncbi:hypothetical protein B0H13DRAFT_2312828 [Mycena leptocephala]|nr:hypothetical protein B0H13DRAFT_2312828 [Mycena leptocephala]
MGNHRISPDLELWNLGWDAEDICFVFHVSPRILYRWRDIFDEFGSVTKPPSPLRGRDRLVGLAALTSVMEVYFQDSTIMLTELMWHLAINHDIAISQSALGATLQRVGLTRKVLQKTASERDEEAREDYRTLIKDPEHFSGTGMEFGSARGVFVLRQLGQKDLVRNEDIIAAIEKEVDIGEGLEDHGMFVDASTSWGIATKGTTAPPTECKALAVYCLVTNTFRIRTGPPAQLAQGIVGQHRRQGAAFLSFFLFYAGRHHEWEWVTLGKDSNSYLPFYAFQEMDTVTAIWVEWASGLNGFWAVRDLEENWGAKWRRNNQGQKTEMGRRKKVIQLVMGML